MRAAGALLVTGLLAAGGLALAASTRSVPAAVATTGPSSDFPNPDRDVAAETGQQTAVFAGGCFWGVEAVFERLNGVADVVSGYAGGKEDTAYYEVVGTGTTGHAESVRITYDPATISYGQLLKIFFAVAHDPTEIDRQGPDVGTHYRSEVFAVTPEQQDVAAAYIRQLDAAEVFPRQIATRVGRLQGFYPAEDYHQNFLDRHPTYPYIVYNDLPKLEHLKKAFPEMLNAKGR
jgi:peptide-methionine (S)-S-oxide reductase